MAAKKTLGRSDYRALLRDIKKLAEQAESRASAEKISAQWAIGERLKRLKLSTGAGYHHSVLRDLSSDTGLAMTTLHQSVKFFDAYKRAPSQDGLSWSHYRVLLRVPVEKERRYYVKKIQEEGWSSKQLSAAVSSGAHRGPNATKEALKRPSLPNYLYAADVLDVIDGDTLDLSVDLGFGVKRELRTRLAVVDAPPLESRKGRDARDFVAMHLMHAASVAVQTRKADIYGRFIVHVFFANRTLSAVECFSKGQYLNELLVREKHAVVIG